MRGHSNTGCFRDCAGESDGICRLPKQLDCPHEVAPRRSKLRRMKMRDPKGQQQLRTIDAVDVMVCSLHLCQACLVLSRCLWPSKPRCRLLSYEKREVCGLSGMFTVEHRRLAVVQ